jgi:hypothetical protein
MSPSQTMVPFLHQLVQIKHTPFKFSNGNKVELWLSKIPAISQFSALDSAHIIKSI